jgi:fucose permease
MASFHASYSLGGLTGAALGGLLIWWRAAPLDALGAIALSCVAAAAIAGHWLAHEPGRVARPGHPGPAGPAWPARAAAAPDRPGLPRRRPAPSAGSWRLLALGLLALCCVITEGAAGSWGGVYLRQILRSSHWFAMAAFAAFSLGMAAGRLAGDRLATRYGPARLIRGCGLLAAAGLAGALASHRPAWP